MEGRVFIEDSCSLIFEIRGFFTAHSFVNPSGPGPQAPVKTASGALKKYFSKFSL